MVLALPSRHELMRDVNKFYDDLNKKDFILLIYYARSIRDFWLLLLVSQIIFQSQIRRFSVFNLHYSIGDKFGPHHIL